MVTEVGVCFIVGEKTLRAGKITVHAASTSNPGPLSITNYGKGQSTFRMSQLLRGPNTLEQGKLVFHKYGNQYFLGGLDTGLRSVGTGEVKKRTSRRARNKALEKLQARTGIGVGYAVTEMSGNSTQTGSRRNALNGTECLQGILASQPLTL